MADPQQPSVALVTGGARRVGRAVSRDLAQRGCRVAIHANTSLDAAQALAAEITDDGGEALALGADLRDEGATRAMVDRARRHFGRLDALVACAAIWEPMPIDAANADDVRKHFDVNAVASFVCAQQAGLIMAEQDTGGAIVLFGDAAAERPQAGYAAYHPSKGAIPAMTRSLAVELAARNPRVRVNAVLPGPVIVSQDEPAERQRAVAEGTLLDVVGHAEHLAHAVAFLLENPFITGVCLPVEGGRRLAGGWSPA
ncbi:MAG: SDR family oxidoreductase [Planctomycetota bacterium]